VLIAKSEFNKSQTAKSHTVFLQNTNDGSRSHIE